MGSMQDQLLKSGLVSEDKLRKAKAEKRRVKKRTGKPAKAKRAPQPVESPEARRAREERRERDRALNLERQRNRERNAGMARVRDFVQAHVQNDPAGEVPYHVNAGRKIKRVYVTPAQHEKLQNGELLVVMVDGKAKLVARDLEEKIRALDPHARIVGPQAETTADDDAYAGYEIPDDLMW